MARERKIIGIWPAGQTQASTQGSEDATLSTIDVATSEPDLAAVASVAPASLGDFDLAEPDTLWLNQPEADAHKPSVFWLFLTISVIIGWGVWTAWIASRGFAVMPSVNDLYRHVGQFLVPASLLMLLWLVGGHVGGRGAARHLRLLSKVRIEQQHLDNRLTAIGQHWLEAHERLVARSHGMAEEMLTASSQLDGISATVDERMRTAVLAAGEVSEHGQAARRHMEGLILALPKVDETARRMADSIRAAGQSAYQYGGQLEERMAQLRAEMSEVDAVATTVGNVVGRHVDRLHQAVAEVDGAAAQTSDQFTAILGRQREAALSLLVELVSSLDSHAAQTEERFAKLTNGFDRLGIDHLELIDQRVGAANESAATLASHLSSSVVDAGAVDTAIADTVRQAISRLATIDVAVTANQQRIVELVDSVESGVDAIEHRLVDASQQAAEHCARAEEVQAALEQVAQATETRLPAALNVLRQAQQDGQALVEELAGRLDQQIAAATDMHSRIDASGGALERHANLLQTIHSRAVGLRDQQQAEIEALSERVNSLNVALNSNVVEWMASVDTTRQELIGAADRHGHHLGNAIDQAISRATAPEVEARLASISVAATKAITEAEALTIRLAEQVDAIEQSSAILTKRVAATQSKVDGQNSDTLARLVARTNEALQSTAVDLTRLLSADVSDQAWDAYLKGDRGVFARRAVRLLNNAEARDVLARYQNDDDFRGLVNRYIHDFEGILRNVMDTRDGAALSVTLLSSDIGKVYVALAQAIERLRH